MDNASTSVLSTTSFQSSVTETSTARQRKTRFWVTYGGRTEHICCYDSSNSAEIEHLLRALFAIPLRSNVVLRNEAGDAVVMSPKLPNMSSFVLEVRDHYKKQSSPYSPSHTTRTPAVSEASTSLAHSPQPQTATRHASAQAPAAGEEEEENLAVQTESSSGGMATSPTRGLDTQKLNFSIATTIAQNEEDGDEEEEVVEGSALQEDTQVEEAVPSDRNEQLMVEAAREANKAVVEEDVAPHHKETQRPQPNFASETSTSTPVTSKSALSVSRHSSLLVNESSTSKLKAHSSQSPLMQSFKYVERLEIFLKFVQELKHRSISDFFEDDAISAGVTCWKRNVTQPEFLAVFSSDLYARANACDLLDSEEKRRDVDAVFQAALAAYTNTVRDLITRSRSDSSPLMSAAHCKQALQAAFDAACKTIKSRSRAMIDQALSSASPTSQARFNTSAITSSTASPVTISVQSPAVDVVATV